jgi:hypothetical protein
MQKPLALDKVQFPSSPTGGEQRFVVADVADRLPVVAARLAAGEVGGHQPFAERRRDRKGEDERIGTSTHERRAA